MSYWYYWDIPTRRVMVHAAECGHCQNGKGKTTITQPDVNGWEGPFDSVAAAQSDAAKHNLPITNHRCK